MVKVEEVQLDTTLLDDGIGMVIMQPFVELCDHEPYHWDNDKKSEQIKRINRTLEIAKRADHGCEKTHFTIFPEYSIPGLEGVNKIQETLNTNSWKSGTIIIGGVDGLTKSEYSTFCSDNDTQVHQENKPERVRDDQWVNCCIIWVKQPDGSLKRWIQPKLVPAAQEELCPAHHMFEGRAVYVFRPKITIQGSELPFRFLSFICKDWIGNIGSSCAIDLVLSELDRQRGGGIDRLDIYLCFILKRNPKPDSSLFLQNTSRYLNENSHISIRRSDGAVFFINNAGRSTPGYCTSFGKSGFMFHPNCSFVSHKEYCPPTYTLKKREGLINCKEAIFREAGACIVSFRFFPPIPAIVRRIPSTPMVPMNPAIVHSIDGPVAGIRVDPRTPGAEVPASVKWVNDILDVIDYVLKNENSHPLKGEIEAGHDTVCAEIRNGSNEFLCKYIRMASYEIENKDDRWTEIGGRKILNVDNWDENERQSLETIVYSLSIIKACRELEISSSPASCNHENSR